MSSKDGLCVHCSKELGCGLMGLRNFSSGWCYLAWSDRLVEWRRLILLEASCCRISICWRSVVLIDLVCGERYLF